MEAFETKLMPYSYDLPDDRIAQRPVHPPESAKMLVVSRESGDIKHRSFDDIVDYIKPGDHFVFNDTKVIPARLFGKLETIEGYDVEVVLLQEIEQHKWTALGFPMRKIRAAEKIFFSDQLQATVLPAPTEDRLLLRFNAASGLEIEALLNQHGTMPIPPYIRNGRGDEQDRLDYQSVFATYPGSVAAPTASLHFSERLISRMTHESLCKIDRITLHVGTASFQPIFVNGKLRRPGQERFAVPSQVMEALMETKRTGGRVIAVGTTVVRALESAALSEKPSDDLDSTELFIEPGFRFRIVDNLVTNFHQPKTTHLLLVEALLGAENLDRSYQAALSNQYRFLSYGDGMFVL
jgi:S-adenosylmethionine:tRNA ribosyltransferase-isomerase